MSPDMDEGPELHDQRESGGCMVAPVDGTGALSQVAENSSSGS
jgi:hypothetical protein